jgi:Prokaryotic E2 family E
VLPTDDVAFLEAKGHAYKVTAEGGFTCLVIQDYLLPPGYRPERSDLLLRLPGGWPDAAPDMFWMDPPVTYLDGRSPLQTQRSEQYLGRTWQRFSRHLPGGAWRAGDGLETWINKIRDVLCSEAPR